MLNARIWISVESRISCTLPDAECQDPDFGGEKDLLYLMLNARIRIRISVESRIFCTQCRMSGSGFRWRVGSPIPDAECQDPDFGGESDLLYLMLNARIQISVESRISDAECQDLDFGGESDLLYLRLNARIRISVESLIFCTGSTPGARKRASLGLVTSTTGHSLCVSSLYIVKLSH
jgi:hypothetical protein